MLPENKDSTTLFQVYIGDELIRLQPGEEISEETLDECTDNRGDDDELH